MKKNLQNSSILEKALKLTSSIFENIDHSKYVYKEYELSWSLYNLVHIYGTIPYYLNNGNNSILRKFSRIKSFILKIKTFLQDVVLLIYSLISILIVKFTKKECIAIWTGDFYNSKTKGDFRVGELYIELKLNDINYVEFIRDNANGFNSTLKNMIKRKRVAIYYNSIERLVGCFFRRITHEICLKEQNELHKNILSNLIGGISQPYKIELHKKLFHFLEIKKFIPWEFADRQSNLIYAAKLLNIQTIGFMHGLGMKNYMAHEYMREFNAEKKIGPDIMGVWSEWWKNYFEQNSNLYGVVEVSGELRKSKIQNSGNPKQIKKVLWISEPLIEPEEVIEYMRYFKNNYQLIIKKRPSTNDIFYNKLIKEYQDFTNIRILEGDILDSIKECDLVVGSHSTAVIEASKLNKPFLLVNTKKWRNYFEVNEELFIENISTIENKLDNVIGIDFFKLKEKYFGKDEDNGVLWLIRKIKNGK